MQIDLTGIATSLIAGVFSILAIAIPLIINSRLKDQQAAAVLSAAVKNALGAIQQAATAAIKPPPLPAIPGVSPALTVGVQYVLNHAGTEAARFGIDPPAIAAKIDAQIGLVKIVAAESVATNLPRITPAKVPVL